jgi:hypothetical protein
MAKPAITKRSVKEAALTYNELDTNFQNLADATISLTAGTAGTQVTSDLNGNITLVAGTGVTLSGDNTAKTITINSSAGDLLTDLIFVGQNDNDTVEFRTSDPDKTFQITTNYDTPAGASGISSLVLGTNNGTITTTKLQHGATSGNLVLESSRGIELHTNPGAPVGVITLDTTSVRISQANNPDNAAITITAGPNTNPSNPNGLARIFTDNTREIQITNGRHQLFLDNTTTGVGITLGAPNRDTSVLVFSGILTLRPMTTTERDDITSPADGSLVYNSTTGKFQGRAAGAWVDLH